MNARQASVLRERLSACFPGSPVEVTPDSDGAQIVIEYQDGLNVRVTTGDQPGVVLRAMLGRDLRTLNGETRAGTA